MSILTALKEVDGSWSHRRLAGFIVGVLVGSTAGILAICLRADWMVVACAFGVPYIVLIVAMICTTAEDVQKLIAAIKGAVNGSQV